MRRATRVLLVALVFLLGGCKEIVYRDLSEGEVNAMVAVLASHGITAERELMDNGAFNLVTDESDWARAIQALKREGYPKQSFASMGEVFKKEGMLSTPVEERARYHYALSQSIAETLSDIDGVVSARVNIVLPEPRPFVEESQPSSAAVFIKYDTESDILRLKPEIKLLVQKSIEGLSYDRITLVMLPASSGLEKREAATRESQPALTASAFGIPSLLTVGLLGLGALAVWRLGYGAGQQRLRTARQSHVQRIIHQAAAGQTATGARH